MPADVEILYPSRLKWWLILCFGLVFVALGLWLFSVAGGWHTLLVTAFFSLTSVVSVKMLFSRKNSLTLGRDTFRVAHFGQSWEMAWHSCLPFSVQRMGRQTMVAYEILADGRAEDRSRSGVLPDTYGLGAEKLVEKMNAYQQRALTRRGDAPDLGVGAGPR